MIKRFNLPKPFFYLLLVFLFLLLLNFLGLFGLLKGVIEKAAIIPLKEEVYRWERIFKKDLNSCGLENEKETSELKAKISFLLEENKEQKRLLSAPLPKNWQFLTVKVINVEGESLNINVGEEEGIKEGLVAVLGESYLGKVGRASKKISEIKLGSDIDVKLVVKVVSGTDGSILGKGLLVGQGQGRMRVEQILLSENVKKGDLVLTNLEGGDLLVGRIEEVTEVKGEPFKTAQVKRLFNPEELNTIFLIRGRL